MISPELRARFEHAGFTFHEVAELPAEVPVLVLPTSLDVLLRSEDEPLAEDHLRTAADHYGL